MRLPDTWLMKVGKNKNMRPTYHPNHTITRTHTRLCLYNLPNPTTSLHDTIQCFFKPPLPIVRHKNPLHRKGMVTSTGYFFDQYWSQLGVVLVTISDQYWSILPTLRESHITLCNNIISKYNYPPCSAEHHTGDRCIRGVGTNDLGSRQLSEHAPSSTT